MKILVYTKFTTTRLEYIFQIIFQQLIGINFEITNDLNFYKKSALPKLNYSNQKQPFDEIFIKSHELLFQKNIQPQKITVSTTKNLPYCFQVIGKESDWSFDIFAMSFYLISRYEEYLPVQKDAHDRFPASESLAFQNNFLQLPLINLWAKNLKELLQKQYPNLTFQNKVYQFQPTYDIDMAWSYQNKGLLRSLGAYFQSIIKLDFKEIKRRYQVQMGSKKDPFYTFDYLENLHKKYKIQPKWFFLLGKRGTFDKNISPQNTAFQKLIRHIKNHYEIGIHPSYNSNFKFETLKAEKQTLEKITQQKITKSRQHFLKLSFPKTYQNLIKIGIKNDFSMGYADQIGFRASIANPFYWYDLENEKITNLKIHPFQIMDVTLRQYLNLSEKEAIEKATEIIEICKKINGTFCSLWHNSSFDEQSWKNWDFVYEQIIENAISK